LNEEEGIYKKLYELQFRDQWLHLKIKLIPLTN
jgi:hypothetical protein